VLGPLGGKKKKLTSIITESLWSSLLKGPRVGVSLPSPEDGNISTFQSAVFLVI
jgi:hypothetical protein